MIFPLRLTGEDRPRLSLGPKEDESKALCALITHANCFPASYLTTVYHSAVANDSFYVQSDYVLSMCANH